ncbi:hypothetical protein [Methanonatronarchaeum sp. AMET-Sl]|uniref:hypothetical protein n=1 Tax=Methanonatronarchaeum sp. AMET-Sl TaxID=3037654 RepID=UPI00244E4063|nr:hypothetical protein [Methanonatronarchaeum sp. AMET-Sl]WGI17885.1 hypothetical protein QEN48_02445 [Methanonatronarchaeum sp. AMET-Sl]
MNKRKKDEEEVKEILLGIDMFLEKEFDKRITDISSTRLHKICWLVIEEFDLNITRAWYKRGQFIFNGQETIKKTNKEGISDIQQGELSEKSKKFLTNNRKLLSNYINTSFQHFIKYDYRHYAPQEFQEFYEAHNIIFDVMYSLLDKKDLNKFQNAIERVDAKEKISNKISKIHLELISNESFNQIEEEYIEFTNIYEDLFLSLKFKAENDELTNKQWKKSLEVFKTYFDQHANDNEDVWGKIAWIISNETVKGRDSERIKNISNNKLNQTIEDLKSINRRTRRILEDFDLQPKEEIYTSSLKETGFPESDKKTIKRFTHTYSIKNRE